MNGYQYISKRERWVSNGNGGQTLKRSYRYNHCDSAVSVFLLCALIASPFFISRKLKNKKQVANKKTLLERLEEMRERSLEKLQQTRQNLWDTIKHKRKWESDHHWMKRLKRYGFAADGTHIKTGVNYQLDIGEQSKMGIDIKEKLKQLEGKTFNTVTGKEFVYTFVSESTIKVSRTNYPIHLSNFEKALEINPTKPSQISNLVRGGSYVFGIITDSRFN